MRYFPILGSAAPSTRAGAAIFVAIAPSNRLKVQALPNRRKTDACEPRSVRQFELSNGATPCVVTSALSAIKSGTQIDIREKTTMDAAELRATQAPIKERYKADPNAALITLKAKGSIDSEGIACKVETGRALAIAGLHPATGGSGLELCSGDMLLEALVACAGVTLKSVATAIEVPLKTGIVSAEGDLDFRGTLGVDKETPVGFREIRLHFDVDTAAAQDKLDLLLKLTERYCVVYQTIKNGPKVSVSLQRV
jgi:uncharacterized OsmC-like protein